jgi:hypothetical protein
MPATVQEVQQVIQEQFPNSDVSGIHEENGRVLGTIVWQDFKEMDSRRRNRLVTERVRGHLGTRGVNVGVLFPLAPGEYL